MSAAPDGIESPQFSGVASGDNARLHPWQSSPSKCGNDEAGNVPQQHAQTPTEETKACHKSQCEHASRGVPGNTKPTKQQARATQVSGRKCSAFLPGAEAAVNARNRVQRVHVRDVTAITLQAKPVGRHLPKHAENASREPPRLRIYLSARQGLPARCFGRADARASSRQNARDLRCRSISFAC